MLRALTPALTPARLGFFFALDACLTRRTYTQLALALEVQSFLSSTAATFLQLISFYFAKISEDERSMTGTSRPKRRHEYFFSRKEPDYTWY